MITATIMTGLICMLFTEILYPAGKKKNQFSFFVSSIYYISGAVLCSFSLFPGNFLRSFLLLLLSGVFLWSGFETRKKTSRKNKHSEKQLLGTEKV